MNLAISKKQISVLFIVVIIGLFLLQHFILSGQVILPQTFSVLGFKIYFYGVILALGVLSAYYFAVLRLKETSLPRSEFDNLVLLLVVNGFVGARLYHVFSSLGYYQNHWSEVVAVWNGGLSIFGAILGALLGLYIYQRYYLTATISFYKLLDFLVPSVILGQIIGRFGNLFNYEAYGAPTQLAWKLFIPSVFRIPPYETFQYFHPLFLYEALAGLLILIILLKWVDIANYLKLTVRSGQVFILWLGLYNVVRFLTEILRIDSPYIFGIKQNLLASGLLVLIAIVMFIKLSYSAKDLKNESTNNKIDDNQSN